MRRTECLEYTNNGCLRKEYRMIEDPMNNTVTHLVQGLLDVIDKKDWFNANDNQRELALLDAESADKYIEDLEDKVEELEWSADDYYQIDKDDMDMIITRAMRDMFFSQEDSIWVQPEELDYDGWLEATIDVVKAQCEKVNKNKE